MEKNNYSIKEKEAIAKNLTDISFDELEEQFLKLKELKCNLINTLSHVGSDVVNYFTFVERLNTAGHSGYSFFDVWYSRKFIQTKKYSKSLFKYYKKNNITDEYFIMYRIFNLYFGAVSIFKPVIAKYIYCKFKPKKILDFTMGWGGRLVGACALDIEKYIGIDLNQKLKKPYTEMTKFLDKYSDTKFDIYFEDAATFDYSKLDYDFVLTSPPYYNIELYTGTEKRDIEEWNNNFYIPVFTNTYKYMKSGYYCLNIPQNIYNDVALKVLGKPYKKILFPKAKRTQDEKYKEYIYVWKKD